MRLASSFHRDGLRRLRLAGEALAVAARRAGVGRDFGSLRGCGALTGAQQRTGVDAGNASVAGRLPEIRPPQDMCVLIGSGSFIQSG
ncbi:hypothetical protein JCM18918_4162 [Cutibacterium acnes JCM 18918]|nr:hypothetical protein JCM18918_4162 [Cutibacterium acnes JCM 18918]